MIYLYFLSLGLGLLYLITTIYLESKYIITGGRETFNSILMVCFVAGFRLFNLYPTKNTPIWLLYCLLMFILLFEFLCYNLLFRQKKVKLSFHQKLNREVDKFFNNIKEECGSNDGFYLNTDNILGLMKNKEIKQCFMNTYIKPINELYEIKNKLKTYKGKEKFQKDIINISLFEFISEINKINKEKEISENLQDEYIIKNYSENVKQKVVIE